MRWPSEERSASARKERLSEREMKNALSTTLQPGHRFAVRAQALRGRSQKVVSQRKK
jgi:hypothetical protein